MCEPSGKLIAWLDGELEKDEMAHVERHIQDCIEFRGRLDAYQEVSRTFDSYRDAVVASMTRRRHLRRWVPVVSVAATLVFAAAGFLVFRHMLVEPLVSPPSMKTAPSAAILETASAARMTVRVHRRHAPSAAQSQTAKWRPMEPAIEIAIPAESMFPPGAVPEGVNFTADLSIATDGSAQQIRLRPRLIRFERRATQP
jgi:anti-sigma factor RsiW